jgi:hypothetical protein
MAWLAGLVVALIFDTTFTTGKLSQGLLFSTNFALITIDQNS